MSTVSQDINKLIIEELVRLAQTETNTYKVRAYRNAITTIKKIPRPIESGKQAMGYQGIGKSIGKKIDDLIESQTQESKVTDNRNQALEFLISIHGIGPKTAENLYNKYGICDSKSLQKHRDLLNHQQIIGFDLREDLQKKIPRQEMTLIIQILERFLHPRLKMTICGSYRRGLPESSDIDVLITKKNWVSGEVVPESIKLFISKLKEENFLTHELAYGDKKYMGVCKLNSTLLQLVDNFLYRRIDIRFIPYDCYYFGVLYFTGSSEFNVKMRQKALSKGYSLNEYNLTKKDDLNEEVLVNSEEEIFEKIGMKYVKPEDRSI